MAFTSIKTTSGWSTDAVQAAYSLLFGWDLRANKVFESLVDFQPKQVPQPGFSVTVQLNAYYSQADVIAATTPLDEETDVTPVKLPQTSKVTFTPVEHGFANQSTIYLSNRGLTPVDPIISKAVAAHCTDTIDYLVQSAARAGTQVIRANSRASTGTIVQNATDYYKATMIRQAVTKLKTKVAQPRDTSGNYFGVLHPDAIHDLREETGAGSWRVPKEYVDPGEIYNGEFAQFEGVRFISTPTVYRTTDNDGATSTKVIRGFIMGQEFLGKCVVSEPTIVLSPVTDKLQRWRGIGWKADLAYKIYRDAAGVRLEGASSIDPTA